MHLLKNLLKGIFLCLFFASLVFAGTYGKITGRVIDAETGEGLPGAAVKIEGTTMVTVTDIDGYYVFLNVPPGSYTLSASFYGYFTLEMENVKVESDRTIEVNFLLKIQEFELQTVEVQATELLVKKDKTETRTIMKSEEVKSLPVLSIQSAVELSAGVIVRDGMQIRGGRPDEVVYVVDGVEIRDPYTNYTQAGVPLLSMEETSISRGGFDVDQGTVSSGAISVVTKEGTNKYEASLRATTLDLSPLGPVVSDFFNSNLGDPYYDYLTGKNTNLSDLRGRWKDDEKRIEFTFGGPLIPTWREGAKFFVSGELFRSHGNFPIYVKDDSRVNKNEAYQWKVSVPLTKAFKLFSSGFYRRSVSYPYSASWRLALDNLPPFIDRHLQFIGGIDHLIGKTFWELRVGFYDRIWKEDVFEDVDHDGIDDFTDRDYDGFVEVDLEYFKKLVADTVWERGHIKEINVSYVFMDIDSLFNARSERYKNKRSYYKQYIHINKEEGYVELPFYWWEPEIQSLYPTISSGPAWWPRSPYFINPAGDTVDYQYHTYGWGQRTNVDTFVVIPDYSTYPPTFDTLLVGNQYLLDDHTYPRDQFRVGKSRLFTVRWNLKSQITKQHEVLAGLEFKRMNITRYAMDYASGGNIYFDLVNPNFEKREGDSGNFIEWFEEHPSIPWVIAGYMRDKIEIEGMVAKVGMRVDYYDPAGYVFSNPENPFKYDEQWLTEKIRLLNEADKAKPKWYISPRLGISHPITANDVLHFTYGHYYQIPPFYQLITSYVFSGAFPIVGNPDIDPERNISYELGITHAFAERFVADITAFYKDIYSWSRLFMYPIGTSGENYSTFINEDYGSVRGIEFEFSKKPGGALFQNLAFSIAYTFQVARGSFSSPWYAYRWAWRGYPLPPHESPLDWDQRHKLTITTSYDVPKGQGLFGVRWLDALGITLLHNYGSGFPYTPPIRSLTEAVENINVKRLPSYQNTDLRMYKRFSIKNLELTLFTDIYNLFNRKDLSSFDNVEWYEYFNAPEGETRNPTVWSLRRRTRVGFEIRASGF